MVSRLVDASISISRRKPGSAQSIWILQKQHRPIAASRRKKGALVRKARPKNLNLFTIRLPINALVSILHRLSGVALYLVLPLMLGLFSLSLSSEAGFNRMGRYLDFWLSKCLLLVIAWAFFHHFYAGLRHLAQDLHYFNSLSEAKYSSRILLIMVATSVVCTGYLIW